MSKLVHGYEVVIGFETHAQLSTDSKIFSRAPTRFGAEPNTNVCPTCLGLPGSLPVLNERAVEFARRMRTGQVVINGGAFNPLAPFGGYKQSGTGRELGRYGLEEFLEVKSLQL